MSLDPVSTELLHDRLNGAIELIKKTLHLYQGLEKYVIYGNAMGYVGALRFAGLIDEAGYNQLYEDLLNVLNRSNREIGEAGLD